MLNRKDAPLVNNTKKDFETFTQLQEYLASHYPKHKLLKLSNSMPLTRGQLCRIIAISHALQYYKEAKFISCDIPSMRKRKDSNTAKNAPPQHPISLRQIAKQASGSKIGEFYNEDMIKKFVKGLGHELHDAQIENAEVTFRRFDPSTSKDPVNDYGAYIKSEIDNNCPPIVYYDTNTVPSEYGQPLLTGVGNNEHSALVIGYVYRERLSFILAHLGKYNIVNADELAIAASRIVECRDKPQIFYKIRTDGHTTRWTPNISFFEANYKSVYDKLLQASQSQKFTSVAKNGDEEQDIALPTGEHITLFRRKGFVNTELKPAFKSAVCTIKPAGIKK